MNRPVSTICFQLTGNLEQKTSRKFLAKLMIFLRTAWSWIQPKLGALSFGILIVTLFAFGMTAIVKASSCENPKGAVV